MYATLNGFDKFDIDISSLYYRRDAFKIYRRSRAVSRRSRMMHVQPIPDTLILFRGQSAMNGRILRLTCSIFMAVNLACFQNRAIWA